MIINYQKRKSGVAAVIRALKDGYTYDSGAGPSVGWGRVVTAGKRLHLECDQ